MSAPEILPLAAVAEAAARIVRGGSRGATMASTIETYSLAAWLDLIVSASGGAEDVERALRGAGFIQTQIEEDPQS